MFPSLDNAGQLNQLTGMPRSGRFKIQFIDRAYYSITSKSSSGLNNLIKDFEKSING